MTTTMNTKREQITTTCSQVSVPRRSRKLALTRADWHQPIGLILLTAIPALRGVLSLVGFAVGTALTLDDTHLPLPIVLHIVRTLTFCLLLAFQFAPGLRRRWPGLRRLAGPLVVLGLVVILRRNIARHRAWIRRGYAIGQGAGTQALAALIWLLIFSTLGEPYRDLLLGASWVINLVVAEWIIRRKSLRRHSK